MKTAYIIFCNDLASYVVLDDEKKAKIKMKKLNERLRIHYSHLTQEEYNDQCYWHIHNVDYE